MSEAAEAEARAWLEAILQEPFGEGVSLSAGLANGVRLCRLANVIRPGSIPKFTLEPKMAVKERENVTLFIGFLKKLGMKDFEIFSTMDLSEDKPNPRAVVIAMHALGRLCQSGEFAALDLPRLGSKVLEKNVRRSPLPWAAGPQAMPRATTDRPPPLCHLHSTTAHSPTPGAQTRVFTEKQLQEANAAVSVLNLGSSSMAKSAASSLLAGTAIAVSAIAPSPAGGGGGSSAAAAAAVTAAPAPAATPPEPAAELPPCPEGWIFKTSKTTGKTYYQHLATGKTMWQLPTGSDLL
jgi:hypothetical protein